MIRFSMHCVTHGNKPVPECMYCFQSVMQRLKTDDDLLAKIRDSVQAVKSNLYEHGLHGVQASSHVRIVKEYAEPAVDACIDAIDSTISTYHPKTDINKEQAATARARRLVDRQCGDERHIIDLLCDEIDRLRAQVDRLEGLMPVIKRCLIKPIPGQKIATHKGQLVLDGYAIVPRDEYEQLQKGVMPNADIRSGSVAERDGRDAVAGVASAKTRLPFSAMPSLPDPWSNPRFGKGR